MASWFDGETRPCFLQLSRRSLRVVARNAEMWWEAMIGLCFP